MTNLGSGRAIRDGRGALPRAGNKMIDSGVWQGRQDYRPARLEDMTEGPATSEMSSRLTGERKVCSCTWR